MNTRSPQVDIEYRRKKNAEEMKHQVITFALMMVLTAASFVAVGYRDVFSPWFTIPVIVVLACVQVGFQLYYFMHMSNRGHAAPALFLYTGVLVGFVTVLAFLLIVWW